MDGAEASLSMKLLEHERMQCYSPIDGASNNAAMPWSVQWPLCQAPAPVVVATTDSDASGLEKCGTGCCVDQSWGASL